MTVAVRATGLHIANMRTRMPFRYGIAAMTALPHVFVGVDLDVDGHVQRGIAADGLLPKWFTKDPATAFRDDVADMLQVIEDAARCARQSRPAASVFDLWHALYTSEAPWKRRYPSLLWGFGVSLVERATIDAFCRATRVSFADAVRRNTLGIDLGRVYDELSGLAPVDLLPAQPLRSLIVRHTIGLSDPLGDDEIPPAARIADGLPQSLQSCIQAYGLTHFKIKLCGDAAVDAERLTRIAGVIGENAAEGFAFTLDGNEQYGSVEAFKDFWRAVERAPLAPFMSRLLFVEQPLPRDVALRAETGQALRAWTARPPLIVDESDDAIGSVVTALDDGYAGVSHKNCKGVFRGVVKACLIAHRANAAPARPYILSGEDLSTVGPVSLLQDLAVMATLGIAHVERNGHHYFTGLSMLPHDVQERVLARHGDLYRRHTQGYATLRIEHGRVAAESLVAAPFGLAFDMDPTRFTPAAEWSFDALGVEG